MALVTLRPLRADEWDPWHAEQTAGYVEQLVRMGGFAPAEAEAKAAADGARLLPDGFATVGHRVLVAEQDGHRVGSLWLGVSDDPPMGEVVWVYDIEVDAACRGQGIGRELMVRAEDEARAMGATTIALNVFAGNAVAIALYESLGYATTETRPSGQNMRKVLTSRFASGAEPERPG